MQLMWRRVDERFIQTGSRMRATEAAIVTGVLAGTGLLVAVIAADPVRQADMAARVALAGHTVAEVAEAEVILTDGSPGLPFGPPVLRLSAHAEEGASVLPSSLSPAQLDAGLRAVAAGLHVTPAYDRYGAAPLTARTVLTPREVEILRCLGDGMSNKAVARALGISAHTVKFHLEAVFAKLGAASRAEAVAKGLRRGLILL